MIKQFVRKDLMEYHPYHAPLKDYRVKLDANELAYSHDGAMLQSLKQWVEDSSHLTRYPDTDSHRLIEAIAGFWKVKKDNILCGVGSDQLIDCFLKVFIEPGDKVLMPNPSFSMYGLTTVLNHGISVEFDLNKDDFTYPVDNIIELYQKENPKVLILCTPNNPTGNCMPIDDIKRLLKVVKCPVMIDEAYGEYIEDSMIEYIEQYNNIIVLRTFSKAYGLAGLRVGYGIGSKEIIDAVNIGKPPYNLNSFSMYAAEQALKTDRYFKDKIKSTIENRKWLEKKLRTMNVVEKVYSSQTNFILVKVKDKSLSTILENNGIMVRNFSEGQLEGCMRITVGTMEENQELIKIMKDY